MPNPIVEYLIKSTVVPLLSLFSMNLLQTDFMETRALREVVEDTPQGRCPGAGSDPSVASALPTASLGAGQLLRVS